MPAMADLFPILLLVAAIGAFAGLMAGLLGIGGGIILVPAFYFAFASLGYDSPQLMQICLATSLATIIVTSARSVMAHNRKGAVDWPMLRLWLPGIVIGSLLGFWAATVLPSGALKGIFGGLGIVVGLYLLTGRDTWRLGPALPGGGKGGLIAGGMGFLSVLMGIGGGTFGVPIMSLYGVPIHRAVATAAGFGVLIALPSVVGFVLADPGPVVPPYMLGSVNLPAFVVVIAMTLITAPWGARLAHAMNPRPLKRVFAVFILIVAGNMLRKSLGW